MSSNEYEGYVAADLLPHKNIGETINGTDILRYSLMSMACQAIRTGGGYEMGQYCETGTGARRQFFPVYGLTNYFKLQPYLDWHNYAGTGNSITGTVVSNFGYWGTGVLGCRVFARVVGSTGYNTGSSYKNDWVAPCRTVDCATSAYVDSDQTAAEGAGPLMFIDPNVNGNITPETFMAIEQAADNGKFTPQTLFSNVYRNNNTQFLFVDPRVDLQSMLDNFQATAYFERESLKNGEYYVYVLMYNPNTWLYTPSNGLDVMVNGVPVAMTYMFNTVRMKVIAGRIQPDSTADLGCNDYVRQTISTKTTSDFVAVGGTTTFTPWIDSSYHDSAAQNRVAVLIWVGGKATNKYYGAF